MNPALQPGDRVVVVSGPLLLTIDKTDPDTGTISGLDPHGDRYTITLDLRGYTRIQVIDQAEPDWPADPIPDTPDTQATEVTT